MSSGRHGQDAFDDGPFDGEEPWKPMPDPNIEPLNLSFYAKHQRHVGRLYSRELRRRARRRRLQHTRGELARIGRRSGTLAGILAVTAAAAYGATTIFGGSATHPPDKTGAPGAASGPSNVQLPVSSGRAGSDSWALRIWRRGGTVCGGLIAAEQEQTGCGPVPTGGHLLTLRLDSPTNRYISGFAAANVTAVRVSAGGDVVRAPTHPLDAQAGAGLPAGTRWFVAILKRGAALKQPRARLTAIIRPAN